MMLPSMSRNSCRMSPAVAESAKTTRKRGPVVAGCAVSLDRVSYSGAVGYHMNKTHWNTIDCNGSISKKLIFELIDHSYELVYKKPKAPKK
jgi:hypothetical protein